MADQSLSELMPVLSCGSIQNIQLPDNFELGPDGAYIGTGKSWLKNSYARQNQDVQISLFYRGNSLTLAESCSFRQILASQGELFNSQNGNAERMGKLQLAELIGNLNNNQVTNKNSGNLGPKFFIEQIQVRSINSKNALYLKGYFHGPDGEAQTHYAGLFIDASPQDENCRVEEVFYQAPPERFASFFARFEECLSSIVWA